MLRDVIDAILVGAFGVAMGAIRDFAYVWLPVQAVIVFGCSSLLDVSTGTTLGQRIVGGKVTGHGATHPEGARKTCSPVDTHLVKT